MGFGPVEDLVSTLFFVLTLSTYSGRLGLVDHSFSISLGDVSNKTTTINGTIGYAFSIGNLSPSGNSRLLAVFSVRNNGNIVVISGDRCSPNRSFRCSCGAGNGLSFSFIPAATKTVDLGVSITDRVIAETSDIELSISAPSVGIRFRGIPSVIDLSSGIRFGLLLTASRCNMGTSTQFIGNGKRICVSKCSTAHSRNITLRRGGLIIFVPRDANRALVRFAISDQCNLPIEGRVAVRMGPWFCRGTIFCGLPIISSYYLRNAMCQRRLSRRRD